MNKNIKRTVAMALTLSAFTAAAPVTSTNILGLQEANASSKKDKIHFDELKVSGAGKIKLSDSKTKYSIYVPRDNETATITIKKENSKHVIDCDSDGVNDIQGGEEGERTCKIKVDLDNKGNDENEFKVKVSDGENEREYTLKIYRKHVAEDDDEDNDDIYLDDLTLSAGNLDFSRKKASFDVYVDKNVDSIKIQAKPEDEDYNVEIGGKEVDKDDKWRAEVDLKEGKNVIEVYIEDEDDDDNPRRTYTLNIYRGTKPETVTNSGEIDTKQDAIYIKKVVIDDGDIPIAFDKRITSYDIKVKKDLENIIIKAEPEENDNIVKIDGSKADSNYRKRVALNATGKTTIELKVYNDEDDDDDDYEERIYNLNIIKEDTSNTNNNSTNTDANDTKKPANETTDKNTNSSVKANQWVKNEYGLWQYYDALGKPIVNQWFKDGANYYYLGDYGIMKTGWQNIDGAWYYLNNSGVMQTGWVQDRGVWYYLNENGTMKTGWHHDSDGKWYYLNEHGVMLTNVYVDNYKLGADGAWVR